MAHDVDFLTEKRKIDDLLSKGYTIAGAGGSFDGDVVVFENTNLTPPQETLLVTNPDTRKYYTSLYIERRNKVSE